MTYVQAARPTLSDVLTGRILDLIRDDGLRPGDRLPATRDLSQRFAVTTPTLREALRRLEATGAIEMRHGSGLYVGDAIGRVVLPNPNLRALPGGRLAHLLGARLLVEPPLAALAALHGTDEGRAALRGVLEEAATHLRGEDAELREANITFHRAVAALAGNTVLEEVVDSLLTVHAADPHTAAHRHRDHDEHLSILEAIESRDAPTAEHLMRSHLGTLRTAAEHRLPPEGPGVHR
jgi:GntR family transcriptional regulator, transcriptional repressor for pyruvate dehydrogenase complex